MGANRRMSFSLAALLFLSNYYVLMDCGSFVHNMNIDPSYDRCHFKSDGWKFDCLPDQLNPTQTECLNRGCCWEELPKSIKTQSDRQRSRPACYFSGRDSAHYKTTDVWEGKTGAMVNLTRVRPSPYPRDVDHVKLEFLYETETRLRITLRDADHTRWEVPPYVSKKMPDKPPEKSDRKYFINLPEVGDDFSFSVYRQGSSKPLLSTTGAMIYSDQFLQLSHSLASPHLWGIGEHRHRISIDVNWTTIALWNHDHVPQVNTNLYGTHPFYINKDENGQFYGVFLHNSNAMEMVVQPAAAITWRTIGGVLDFYILLGPTPKDIIQQYTSIIGRTFMPPYWSLGFQLCWQLYGTANNTLATMDRVRGYGIPQDVQWNDIDYAFRNKVFTTGYETFGNQPALVEEVHRRGMHYMMMVDCGISTNASFYYPPYDVALERGLFINETSRDVPLVGRVWPGTTSWPDFLNPDTQDYWTSVAGEFHKNVSYDGMWIDMNEISSFADGSIQGCPKDNHLDNPPYVPGIDKKKLWARTICPSARHKISTNYNAHSLYGFYETIRSHNALKTIRRKRPFVISRSTYAGQGHYGGHWSGDNKGTFEDMAYSVSAMLHMNMFGVSVTGSDICGFRMNATTELCTRWHQLGAFYVFSRNHNADDCYAQDPGMFGPKSAASTRKAFLARYTLLPYLYTLVHRSHAFGETVARALFIEFPEDDLTYNIDKQFLWGPALSITPVLEMGARKVDVYLPTGKWYDFYTGNLIQTSSGHVTLPAPFDVINLQVRGGYILPMQKPELTTTLSRKNRFWLFCALDESETAEGQQYFDDGDSLDTYEKGIYNLLQYKATKNGITSQVLKAAYVQEPMILSNVTVCGLKRIPVQILVDGKSVAFNYDNQVLRVPSFKAELLKSLDIKFMY